MISVEEALAHVLALAPGVRSETVPLDRAFGRVLAGPVASRITQPPFDASAMDGYAVRTADAGHPLRVVGEAAAGGGFEGPAEPLTAVRIFTGAPVPAGYDRVVMQENVSRSGDTIVPNSLDGATNIRPAGTDFREGQRFHPARALTAADVGLLAAMNLAEVSVARKPRVAILAGGDELVAPGTAPGPGQIISSNDFAIAALVQDAGGEPFRLPIARDTVASLEASLQRADGADLLITIGGASVGDHDLIAPVAGRLGMTPAFHRIAMRPGKPLMAGRLRTIPMLGLPGNPVSSIVCSILFVQPLVRAMLGLEPGLRWQRARLATDLPAEGNRQHYLRATLAPGDDLPVVTPFDSQDSARLWLMAQADALVVRPASDPPRNKGDVVTILPLRD